MYTHLYISNPVGTNSCRHDFQETRTVDVDASEREWEKVNERKREGEGEREVVEQSNIIQCEKKKKGKKKEVNIFGHHLSKANVHHREERIETHTHTKKRKEKETK